MAVDRKVSKTVLPDGTLISTVLLPVEDRRLEDKFETMVVGGYHDGDIFRYPTLEDAIKGHEEMVIRCKKAKDGEF